jgi:hypothetical protein
LDAIALRIDGKTPVAATTRRRKRAVFYNALEYAVEPELLDFNPIDKVKVRSSRKKVVEQVDRRVGANPHQVRDLLTALNLRRAPWGDTSRGAAASVLRVPLAQVESPLAGRPYDLRPAGVSPWLNAGVQAPDVAERAGHSVDVLLRVGCSLSSLNPPRRSLVGRCRGAVERDGCIGCMLPNQVDHLLE